MDFGQALQALRNGARVARHGWNGRRMFVVLVPGSTITVAEDRPLGQALPHLVGTPVDYRPHLDMWTVDEDIVPWVASQTDLLAEDWTVVE